MKKQLIARVCGLVLVAVSGGVLASVVQAAGGVNCPDVYRPVICPNGQIYSNACYAGLAGQHNCVPWGDD